MPRRCKAAALAGLSAALACASIPLPTARAADSTPAAQARAETPLAGMTVDAALESVHSGQSVPIYLLIENRASKPLTVLRIAIHCPAFLTCPTVGTRVIAPHRTRLIETNVEVKDRVRSGRQEIVFHAVARRRKGRPTDLFAAEQLEASVPGSELLTVLGVPTLFLIPGFLIFATMSLLWRLRVLRKPWDGMTFPIEVKSPEFWVAVVTISVPLVALWNFLGPNLFEEYGLEDVAWLWAVSVALGVLAYLAWVLLRNRRHGDRTPDENDSCVRCLEKLHRQGLGIKRERLDYQFSPTEKKALYLLQPADGERRATWLSPAIDYTWLSGDAELKRAIDEHIAKTDDAGLLAKTLQLGIDRNALSVKWSPEGAPFDKPVLADQAKLSGAYPLDAIVHEQ